MRTHRFILLTLALLLTLTPLCANAESSVGDLLLDDTWTYAAGGKDLQTWLDEDLAAGAGGTSDNDVLCLMRANKSLDYSAYIEAAASKLEAGISNVTTRMRTALALLVCGAGDRVPEGIVDECAGKMGIMSWVWALHLVNNGISSQTWTAETLSAELLSRQLEDGGWRVTGDTGDVDATAMCLQALASVPESEALDAAIARALDFLSSQQKESGGFASMGEENAESAAQVLIALSSLGVEPDDERFVKAGKTPLDAMLSYRQPTGGFSHLSGGEANPTATAQALQALIALKHPGEPFYDFTNIHLIEVKAVLIKPLPSWKRIAFIVIGILTLVGIVFALTRKLARFKNLLVVLIVAGIACAAVTLLNFDSVDVYYDPEALSDIPADGSVTLSIRCDSVAGRTDDGSTPEDGVILPPTEIPFAEGDSVFDALTAAARTHSIQLEYTGSESAAYVTGINYLYEFAHGELSGWLYSVNGERISSSCSSCLLHDGDIVLWEYTTDLGGDVGDKKNE